MLEKLKRIFGVKKATFDFEGESEETECLFIEVEESINVITRPNERAKVQGKCYLYSPSQKLPFGFFSKAIQKADPNDTKDFFFFEFETNSRRYRDKVQRGFSFVYFFDGQYDPDTGSITSVEFSVEEH